MNNDRVLVQIPDGIGASTIYTLSGTYLAEIRDGQRIVMLPLDDARTLVCGTAQSNLPWRDANRGLVDRLGPVPKPVAGINIAQMRRAAWEATRPSTIAEDIARMRAAVMGVWR